MSPIASSIVRASSRRAFTTPATRSFSSSGVRSNYTRQSTATPLTETIRNVAERAQEGVTLHASAEGFKAGVVYTLLGGSALAAGYLILNASGGREMRERELL